MTSTVVEFIARIDAFLERTGMAQAAFGEMACKDRSFVADLKSGSREPRLSTIEKVEKWMAEYQLEPLTAPERRSG